MLYPLSYEGLPCTFALVSGESPSVGFGLATSLPTVCAAAVPRAVWARSDHRLDTRGRLYDCSFRLIRAAGLAPVAGG